MRSTDGRNLLEDDPYRDRIAELTRMMDGSHIVRHLVAEYVGSRLTLFELEALLKTCRTWRPS